MENQEYKSHHSDASRPSIGFPLGTALLLIIIFCLSGFFSCCYHWERLRSLRGSFSEDTDPDTDTTPESPSKSKPTNTDSKLNKSDSLPVVMPGDRIPKFIALPCPCEPGRPEKIALVVHNPLPPPPPSRPPPPPLPIPYYI
ncbi:uncharacterized protein At5g65660-like [Macadamia integrifolia]|uniref:uncharacterized protein At5g65660-like n=1 Tax=Macadamia integrifolia TaxID=60698 RepID=UPI001C52A47E|nr:uncharacterized protein At5g65660-like [Macadamia integrifolia]